jgi:hypothetical protein
MAKMNTEPTAMRPADAIAALDEDLSKVLKGKTIEETGWTRLDPLTLLVPVNGGRGDKVDDYLLRLGFGYYREWPPSAQFVNPVTKVFEVGKDEKWLPKIEGWNELHVHANYNGTGQLICCSNTLEFYKVRHGMEAKHLWNPERQNFAATLAAINWALRSTYYKGRQA